ncbi:MAG TPA: hypothetical protein VJ983_00355 [candidate division Zixibacteria bacterium]|nr:hypothetical protein [candidate division Zixibacteria bacterium]
MKWNTRQTVVLLLAILAGTMICWIDTRPTWDDTGITVGLILITTAILGAVEPKRAWLTALAVGLWLPLWNIFLNGTYASSVAILFAFAGAYVGALFGWILLPRT